MFGRIYCCTECGLKKYKEQVHLQYKFAFYYTTNRFIGPQRRVYFKVLCICKKCFSNIATEGLMWKRKRDKDRRISNGNEDFQKPNV